VSKYLRKVHLDTPLISSVLIPKVVCCSEMHEVQITDKTYETPETEYFYQSEMMLKLLK